MKIFTLISVATYSLILLAAPMSGFAKEQSQNRHVVVKNVNSHAKSEKSHSGNHNSHRRKYRHHHNHSSRTIFIGATIGHSSGHHGFWYNGYPWCATHSLYHIHHHGYYEEHYYRDPTYKVASYIELDGDGKCFRVTEYSNGDERRKRIRDHFCAEIEEWDEFEDPTKVDD